jgi:hypothetical protein
VRTWIRTTPHTAAFAHAGKSQKWFGRRRAGERVLRQGADMGRSCVPYAAAVRLKKPAAVFTGRGLQNSCEDENMKVICPTCQTLLSAPMPDCTKGRSQRQLVSKMVRP